MCQILSEWQFHLIFKQGEMDGNSLGHGCICRISKFILLHEKFWRFDWLRAVSFQLNLKYLHVKITKLLRVVIF